MSNQKKEALKKISKQLIIKKIIKIFCYFLIAGSIFFYTTFGLEKSKTIKLINDYKTNKNNFIAEKVMTNPSIKIKYNDNEIYQITAEKAFHKDNKSEITLENVKAQGAIGSIEAGNLTINQEGDRLIFQDNPILILNQN